MSKCACGQKFSGTKKLSRHQRECDTFWQSVYTEMRRIAYLLYNRPVPLSPDEWNRNRGADFYNSHTYLFWGQTWHGLQERAGMGIGQQGKSKRPLPPSQASKRMDATALAIEVISVSPEVYMALPGDGLPICERLYLETGRMWVR